MSALDNIIKKDSTTWDAIETVLWLASMRDVDNGYLEKAAAELVALRAAAKEAQEALIVARDDYTLSELAWSEVTNAIHTLVAVLNDKEQTS